MLLSLGGALLLAWAAKRLAGRRAAVAVLIVAGSIAAVFDQAPALFCALSLTTALLVRASPESGLHVMFWMGFGALAVLLLVSAPITPAVALLAAWGSTLATITYRGWEAKQLVD